jgi:uncharacterized protein (DUF486 family)
MNGLKRILGIVWMLMAPSLVGFMLWSAADKIGAASAASKSNTTLQWVIILAIFIPVCVGLLIFGYYSYKGEYDHLPENSSEI